MHEKISGYYSGGMYDQYGEATAQSASVVVPLLLELVPAGSVIDVGCGRGIWLREFQRAGVERVAGLDGKWIEPATLVVDRAYFTATDFGQTLRINGKYDLAICLEVAEHLRPSSADALVEALAGVAPVVLFSAAVPGQEGANHVNLRWPRYWRQLFAHRGFKMFDPIRPKIRDDCRVLWWYRQNLVLFASDAAIAAHPALAQQPQVLPNAELEWVHRHVLDRHRQPSFMMREAGKRIFRAAFRRLTGTAARLD